MAVHPGIPTSAQTSNPTQGGGGSKWDWVKGILPVVGSVIGSVLDKASQDATNKANAQQAQKQMDFQREMASTQYQRGVEDIRAAGLNPALAYKQGGNDAPGGAAAKYENPGPAVRLQQAVAAYTEFANGAAQRNLIREQASATNAMARKTALEAAAVQPQAALGTNADYIRDYGATEVARRRGERFVAERTAEQWEANMRATQQGTSTARSHAKVMESQAILNEQQYMNEWFRKNIAPYLNSSAKVMDAVGGVSRTAKGVGIAPLTRYY